MTLIQELIKQEEDGSVKWFIKRRKRPNHARVTSKLYIVGLPTMYRLSQKGQGSTGYLNASANVGVPTWRKLCQITQQMKQTKRWMMVTSPIFLRV